MRVGRENMFLLLMEKEQIKQHRLTDLCAKLVATLYIFTGFHVQNQETNLMTKNSSFSPTQDGSGMDRFSQKAVLFLLENLKSIVDMMLVINESFICKLLLACYNYLFPAL